jgi:hypothetical protein
MTTLLLALTLALVAPLAAATMVMSMLILHRREVRAD